MDSAALLEPVQFAVLLRAHTIGLKLLPSRLEKAIGTEIHKMSDLVIAHQRLVEKMASLIHEEATKGGRGGARAAAEDSPRSDLELCGRRVERPGLSTRAAALSSFGLAAREPAFVDFQKLLPARRFLETCLFLWKRRAE